ncbi:dihydrodipicolinate synthase family protein [Leifsonia sp. 1010]|uniref:dihydrodipicolinate synthase family protein n=1 Tax=Leifsonia sp. 1010 TaxID=2817769 RepID=UPI002859D8D5|nr:dihydrodipicolinate synthase family protein [Leifsonia sp. 1010]MDR6610836.1 4-hydroxy-tetrahydrodipicolinate synthase [Leifsonia sp. 1010]
MVDASLEGLSAFPLTPLAGDRLDERAFRAMVRRLAAAPVDSITALGSTGSYAYLSREERRAVVSAAVAEAGDTPVFAGIGGLRTSHVRQYAEDAQSAGAAAVLLAPMTYQALTADDVYGLYADVDADLSVPMIVYDNPATTHFTFTDDLYARIATLPTVASIKIPGVPADPVAARARIDHLRSIVPGDVTIGVSGDVSGAAGLNAGCDAWYSVIAGTLPDHPAAITAAARAGDAARAEALSHEWDGLWALFAAYGSLRVTAAIAEELGWASRSCLPRPILGLGDEDRARVSELLRTLGLTTPR